MWQSRLVDWRDVYERENRGCGQVWQEVPCGDRKSRSRAMRQSDRRTEHEGMEEGSQTVPTKRQRLSPVVGSHLGAQAGQKMRHHQIACRPRSVKLIGRPKPAFGSYRPALRGDRSAFLASLRVVFSLLEHWPCSSVVCPVSNRRCWLGRPAHPASGCCCCCCCCCFC